MIAHKKETSQSARVGHTSQIPPKFHWKLFTNIRPCLLITALETRWRCVCVAGEEGVLPNLWNWGHNSRGQGPWGGWSRHTNGPADKLCFAPESDSHRGQACHKGHLFSSIQFSWHVFNPKRTRQCQYTAYDYITDYFLVLMYALLLIL